jgi:hypothetical protein
MDDDFDSTEMTCPVSPRANVANRSNFGARPCFCRAARYAENKVAARSEATAQRIADEARCAGHQNARQARSSSPQPAAGWRKRSRRKCIKEAPFATQGPVNQRGPP